MMNVCSFCKMPLLWVAWPLSSMRRAHENGNEQKVDRPAGPFGQLLSFNGH